MSIRVNFVSQSPFSTDAFFFFPRKRRLGREQNMCYLVDNINAKTLSMFVCVFFFSFLFFLSQLVLSA